MANGFFQNGQQVNVATQGCGAPSQLPGVAVYSPEVTCANAGYGASTFASPGTALRVGLTTPVASFTLASSSGARHVLIGGDLCAAALAILVAEIGAPIVLFGADGVATLNRAAQNLNGYLCTGGQLIGGLVGKTSDALDGLTATQYLFDPCNPCFASSTDFVCANGCGDNSNFILSNAVLGVNAGLIIDVPAGVTLKVDVCSCAPEVKSFANCPPSVPAIAQITNGGY